MAGADYYRCAVCDGKAFYDSEIDWAWQHVGDVQALCPNCIKTHTLEVVPRPERVEFPVALWCYKCKTATDSDHMAVEECPHCKAPGYTMVPRAEVRSDGE